MNKHFFLTGLVKHRFSCFCVLMALMACLCSCGSDRGRVDPVDLTDLITDFHKMGSQSMSVPIDTVQRLSCRSVWWTDIKVRDSDNDTIKNLIRLYNYDALANCVLSDYEILARAWHTGNAPLVLSDSVLTAFADLTFDAIHGDVQKREAVRMCAGFLGVISGMEELSQSKTPAELYGRYDSLVRREVVAPLNDSVLLREFFDRTEQMVAKDTVVDVEIMKQIEQKRFGVLLRKVFDARSFDEQCALVIACSNHSINYSTVWTLKLMSALLESGKYSPLLWRLWVVWRGLTQWNCYGLSRDSVIPNDLYDGMRKRLFETAIAYLREHPGDRLAAANAFCLANYQRVVREGVYAVGNDAMLDLLEYCPGFYNDPEI